MFRASVRDETGAPVPDATVTIWVNGPETLELTSGPSNASGIAEAVWNTQSPNKKGVGGTTFGSYDATVTGMTASGYVWNQVATGTTIRLNQ